MTEQTGGSADDRVIAFAATLELLLSATSGEEFGRDEHGIIKFLHETRSEFCLVFRMRAQGCSFDLGQMIAFSHERLF